MHGDSPVKKRSRSLTCVDLFCGAGGTSTGLLEAAAEDGYNIQLTAVNHWDVAIATHSDNHPEVVHYNQSIELINPASIVPGMRLQLLVASPECTHHSRARGGKPRSDQKRADAWLLMRWIEDLYVENLIVENVQEFMEWGPLNAAGKPDKRYKGQYFERWVDALRINYSVEYKVLNCADYGDPTTRERFFLIAKRGTGKKITWPEPSHVSRKILDKMTPAERHGLQPWVPARDIIDWSIESKSIFGRKRPLKPNTLRRIFKGFEKYSLKNLDSFIVPQFSTAPARDMDRPLGAITTTSRGVGLCEPVLLAQGGGGAPRPVSEPAPTIVSKGAVSLVEVDAFQLNLKGSSRRDRAIEEPTFTQAGGNHQGLVEVEPFMVPFYGEAPGQEPRTRDVNDPMQTVTSSPIGVCEPFIVSAAHGGNTNPARDVNEPLGSVLGTPKHAICEPFLFNMAHTGAGAAARDGSYCKSVDDPLSTVAGKGMYGAVEPILVNMKGKSLARPIDEPTFTQTKKTHQYLAEAYIVKFYSSGDSVACLDDPLDTVTGKDRFGLCIPSLGGAVFDIRFRMLQPHELAAATSFPKGYRFSGTREQKVKQIGNAVPVRTAKALARAVLEK